MFLERQIYNWVRPDMESFEDPNGKKDEKSAAKIVNIVLYILIFIIAIIVSWDCNKEVSGILKFIYVIIAGMFNTFYLIFYMVYRLWLGNKCY
jgi:succinate dehydrogenase hydrophobic anchor subunit